MRRRAFFAFSLLSLVVLGACSNLSPASSSTPAVATRSPLSVSVFSPVPTATATATPTPLPHPADFDDAFARGLIHYESRKWLVSASYRSADGGLQTAEFTLLPDTFSTNEAIKNPLAPATVRALDENGQEVTLIWNKTEGRFRVAPAFQEIYTGVNSKEPFFNQEAYAQIPSYTLEDVQSGDAVRFLLSHIIERMNKGESLSDILYMNPEATRNSWQRCGGNSLIFELLPDGKIAELKAKGNDQSARELRYDNMAMKTLPFGANIEINGQSHFAFYIANFDPQDPSNPDPNNLSNWKFFLSIPARSGNPESPEKGVTIWGNSFQEHGPLIPYVILYGDEKYQQNHPLLAQLLSIEGNDAMRDENTYFPAILVAALQNYNWGPNNPIVEWVLYGEGSQLPPKLQLMILLFEVGVAR